MAPHAFRRAHAKTGAGFLTALVFLAEAYSFKLPAMVGLSVALSFAAGWLWRPGGLVVAYAWDMEGGGFPFAPIHTETRALGFMPPLAPNPDASRLTVLTELWTNAGLEAVETREITIRRPFADFDEFWRTSTGTGGLKPLLDSMTPEDIAQLRTRVRARLSEGADGTITGHARANAIKGRVPKS